MGLLRIFWEFFWQIYGVFLVAVGALAILNGARLYWLSRRSIAAEKMELQSFGKHRLWNGVYFAVIGFSFTLQRLLQPISFLNPSFHLGLPLHWFAWCIGGFASD